MKEDYDQLFEERKDIKNIQVYANKFKLLTPDEERKLCCEFFDIKFLLLNACYLKHPLFPILLRNLVPKLNKLGDELINRNLRLVLHSSQSPSYTGRGLAIFDLFMEGFDGLKYATWYKYNPYMVNPKTGRTNKFSTYVTYWIKQRIGRSIEKKGSAIKVAGHIQSIMSKIRQVVRAFVSKNQERPSPETIVLLLHERYPGNAGLKDITAEKVAEYGRLKWLIISLDEEAKGDENMGGLSLIDFLSANESYQPEVEFEEVDRKDQLMEIIKMLSQDEQFIIMYETGLIDGGVARSLKQIAKLMGIPLKEVIKKEESAMLQLRELATKKELNLYL